MSADDSTYDGAAGMRPDSLENTADFTLTREVNVMDLVAIGEEDGMGVDDVGSAALGSSMPILDDSLDVTITEARPGLAAGTLPSAPDSSVLPGLVDMAPPPPPQPSVSSSSLGLDAGLGEPPHHAGYQPASSRTPSVSSQGSVSSVTMPSTLPGASVAGAMSHKDYAVYDARAALDASTRTVGALREELRQQAAVVRGYEAENTALVAELKLVQTQHQTTVDDAAGAEERMAALRFASRESVDRLEDQYRNTGAITDGRVVALEQALAEEKAEAAAAEALWVDKTAGFGEQLAALEQENAALKQALDDADRSYQDELARLSDELAQVTSAAATAAAAAAAAAAAVAAGAVEGDEDGDEDGNVSGAHRGRLAQIEKQFVSMQAQYTERIADLELQLAAAKGKPSINTQHRPFTRVKELEMELINSTAAYKGRIAKLEQQLAATPDHGGGGGGGGKGGGKGVSAATRYVPAEVAAHLDREWAASGAVEETAQLRAQLDAGSQVQQQQQQQVAELVRRHAEMQADHREQTTQLRGERDHALARLQQAGHGNFDMIFDHFPRIYHDFRPFPTQFQAL